MITDLSDAPANMPELGWRYGYPFALLFMAISAALLLGYFLRQRWLAPFSSQAERSARCVLGHD